MHIDVFMHIAYNACDVCRSWYDVCIVINCGICDGNREEVEQYRFKLNVISTICIFCDLFIFFDSPHEVCCWHGGLMLRRAAHAMQYVRMVNFNTSKFELHTDLLAGTSTPEHLNLSLWILLPLLRRFTQHVLLDQQHREHWGHSSRDPPACTPQYTHSNNSLTTQAKQPLTYPTDTSRQPQPDNTNASRF